MTRKRYFWMASVAAILFRGAPAALASDHPSAAGIAESVACRTVEIDGVHIFYREAGPRSLPTLVLLHGNPSSSFMFRDLIPRLSVHFHVLAPDYPGFGYSDAPPPGAYHYSFEHLAQTTDAFLNKVGAKSYILYMQDYGGPVGFRIATAHPERVRGVVIQNANAYQVGFTSSEWRDELNNEIRNGGPAKSPALVNAAPASIQVIMKNIKPMYVTGARDVTTISPDCYTLDAAMLSRPGQDAIHDEIDDDYYTNIALYTVWQQWLRVRKPRTLIVWGQGDPIFNADGARAYLHDVPNAKLVFFKGSHFLLEEYAPEVARQIIETFAGRSDRG
jgi:pimeloyl-ACP methyl ester carboxylesterase